MMKKKNRIDTINSSKKYFIFNYLIYLINLYYVLK